MTQRQVTIREGWSGIGSWRRYAVTGHFGTHTLTIAMSERDMLAMSVPRAQQWKASARRRIENDDLHGLRTNHGGI